MARFAVLGPVLDLTAQQRVARIVLADDVDGSNLPFAGQGADEAIDQLVDAIVQAANAEAAQALSRKNAKRLAKLDAAAKAVAPRPSDEAALTPTQLITLDTAEKLAQGSRLQRQQGRKLAREVQAELDTAREREALDLRETETRAIAKAHGVDVVTQAATMVTFVTDEYGARVLDETGLPKVKGERVKRAVRLSGLESLARAKSISERELRAGLAYGMMFEQAPDALRSGLAERIGGHATVSTDNMVKAKLLQAYANARLRQIEHAVDERFGRESAELNALRSIAGQGMTVREYASGGRARTFAVTALKSALEVVSTSLQQSKKGACESGAT